MYKYLLSQLDRSLVWVQWAAHGASWGGYSSDDMNAIDAVKQTISIHRADGGVLSIKFWQRSRQVEHSFEGESWENIVWLINQLIRDMERDVAKLQ